MRTLSTLFITLLLAGLVLVACGAPAPGERPDPDFSLTLSPTTLELEPGDSAPVTVSIIPTGGFSGPVTVSLEEPPTGVSAAPLSLETNLSGTLTVAIAEDAPALSKTLAVRGLSGGLTRDAELALSVTPQNGNGEDEALSLLVFTRRLGWHHNNAIAEAILAVQGLGRDNGFTVVHSEDPSAFSEDNLAGYDAVMFLLTSDDEETAEDVLDEAGKAAFEGYIQAGGGFVGVHSASDTGYGWPWYGELVGAVFDAHPTGDLQFQEVALVVEDADHPSTRHLPNPWRRSDEWYNFRSNPRDRGVTVLLRIDTATFEGGTMGDDHPIAWYQDFGGGRSWYTAGGHTAESYADPAFMQHLLGGILYAAGRED